ncbi:MAG: competence/damage-inducible protein A [Chloroflexi bacterium]|nr:competence/damage-inducible protein A [Chloroflexota bacterium]
MKAEIIATGTELLLGEIVDANSPYLANQLSALGIDLYWISVVGDNPNRLIDSLRRAWERSDLVLTTGGLGPTQGDITRESIASFLGEETSIDPLEERRLRQFFADRKMDMPNSNLRQATKIPSAEFLPNPLGTAPGWWVERDGHILITMPGPPEEMHSVWQREVVPRLRQKLGGVVIISRVLKTFGVSEAKIGELMGGLVQGANPTVATYAKPDGIHLRITAKADSQEEARRMVAGVELQIRSLMVDSIWGVDDDTIASVVGDLLAKRGRTLATMESCTGGLLSATITSVPGSSAYFRGGIVSYSNDVKIAYGVPEELIKRHGAVSQPVAEAMAGTVRRCLGSDIGIGITGVAGPSKLEDKSPGTVFIAVDDGSSPHTLSRVYPGSRQRVRERASVSALFELRKTLVNE